MRRRSSASRRRPGARSGCRPDALPLADARVFAVRRRRLRRHPRAGGAGLLRGGGGPRHVPPRARREAPCTHHATFHPPPPRGARRRPPTRPPPPIWRAVSSAGSVRECGRIGAPILIARIPIARVPERLALYDAGLAESGLDGAAQQQLREKAAVWRFVHLAESQSRAEDELAAALLETRRHMIHARTTHNPSDFQVEASRGNPRNDPRLSHEDGVRYSLEHSALYGSPARVAEQVAALRDAGAQHVLCQMSVGYLPHAAIMEAMRRFGEDVIPRFR